MNPELLAKLWPEMMAKGMIQLPQPSPIAPPASAPKPRNKPHARPVGGARYVRKTGRHYVRDGAHKRKPAWIPPEIIRLPAEPSNEPCVVHVKSGTELARVLI